MIWKANKARMNNNDKIILIADDRERIDKYISNRLGYSRSLTEELLFQGRILVGGQEVKKNYKLSLGEEIMIEPMEPVEVEIKPYKMPLDIIYEDDDILIVNKAKGVVVHPAPGNYDNTLVNGLLYYDKHLSTINGKYRPGIVHRIDKDTSGIIVVAKNNQAHNSLSDQFKEHSISRKYLALVLGNITEGSGEVNLPIGRDPKSRIKMAVVPKGKPAITKYRVLERFNDYTLVECTLETGRTHQIRLHMAYLKHPVAGDPLYGRCTDLIPRDGQYLHAFLLGIKHPKTGEYMEFEVSMPDYFSKMLEKLRGR